MTRYLFAPVLAARPWLLLKGTLVLVAFDLVLERASHGGRYGVGGFNVAHFGWLDAIQPDVTPALFVGLTIGVAVLALTLAFAERPPRWLLLTLSIAYTWTWAMSMLDSYQHHYLLSWVLFAMAFFPRLGDGEALAGRDTGATKGRSQGPYRGEEASAGLPSLPHVPAWAYVTLSASIAIVYAYTAYSKTSSEWLTGAALREVTGGGGKLASFIDLFAGLGIDEPTFWRMMGHSTVLVQIACSAGYLLAPLRDVGRSRWISAFAWLCMLTALSFHFGAEHLELKIGWFSWYMIGYALVLLLPGKQVHALAWLFSGLGGRGWRARFPWRGGWERGAVRTVLLACLIAVSLVSSLDWKLALAVGVALVLGWVATALRWEGPASAPDARGMGARVGVAVAVALLGVLLDLGALYVVAAWLALASPLRSSMARLGTAGPRAGVVTCLVAAAALVLAGLDVDLPGAAVASYVLAGAIAVAGLVSVARPISLERYALGAVISSLALWLSIASSEVRWDYYRNVGGDHRRRGELREAYLAYDKANRYAPQGQDRRRQRAEVRELLEARGEWPLR